MRRLLLCVLTGSLLMSTTAFAKDDYITRRDGFIAIWASIHRATDSTRETPFTDVPKGSVGFDEITYAKYRGILDDDDAFHPDEPLMRQDALLWLFRTRSVDDIDELTFDALPALMQKYPLQDAENHTSAQILESLAGGVTEQDLMTFMRLLDEKLATEEHEVSLYSEKFQGKGTAFGESFDMHALTAAHRTFPYNTLVKVTNVSNHKSVTVRINDRGPYVDGRDMDLSLAAFTTIEDRSKGILHATFQRLGDVNLVDECTQAGESRAVRIAGTTRLSGGIPRVVALGQKIVLRSTKPIVLHSITYPDGNVATLEDWILPGESHDFTPSVEGLYAFDLGSLSGRRRIIQMTVRVCGV